MLRVLVTAITYASLVMDAPISSETAEDHWIVAWAAMPQLTEPANLPSAAFVSYINFLTSNTYQVTESVPKVSGHDNTTDSKA